MVWSRIKDADGTDDAEIDLSVNLLITLTLYKLGVAEDKIFLFSNFTAFVRGRLVRGGHRLFLPDRTARQ